MAGDRPDIELEIVIPENLQIDECLDLVAKRCSSAGLRRAGGCPTRSLSAQLSANGTVAHRAYSTRRRRSGA